MEDSTTADIVKSVIEKESQFKSITVSKQIDIDLDLGSLLAVDTNVVNDKQIR